MHPKFWKLSQGFDLFTFEDCLKSIEDRLVYVHKDTPAMGLCPNKQGEDFVSRAEIGDYFYLTHGNKGGIYLLGQFVGPANFLSSYSEGWVDRPFRVIARAKSQEFYAGQQKWWTPNFRSTFVEIPEEELSLFEELILYPYFKIKLKDHGFDL